MLLEVEAVTKSYPGTETAVLRGVSLTLDSGGMLALTGESGSGKSTLLHLIGGLDTADSGRVCIDGTDLTPLDDAGRAALRRATVGVIFQQFNLIPSLSVAANIAFQARLAGRQQRVAVARTLAAGPRLVLADEPTGNLDETSSDAVMSLLQELVEETGAGLILVTHSERLAARLPRRLHLRAGQLT